MWLKLVVDLGERQRDHHGAAGAGAEREHAQVGAAHGAIGEQLPAPARGDHPLGAVGWIVGEEPWPPGTSTVPVGIDELHVSRRPTEARGATLLGSLAVHRLRERPPGGGTSAVNRAGRRRRWSARPQRSPGVPGVPERRNSPAARWRREESTWPRRSERTATYTTTAASSTATATARPATAAMRPAQRLTARAAT